MLMMMHVMIFLIVVVGIVLLLRRNPCLFGHDLKKVAGSESDEVWYRTDTFGKRDYSRYDMSKYAWMGTYSKAYIEVCVKCGKVFDYVAEGKKAIEQDHQRWALEDAKKEADELKAREIYENVMKNKDN